jgi:RNA polymerase sigma-70 factor (ECF subfamily)
LNEGRLIRRALAGDAAAERSLFEAHVDRIYRLAYRMTGDEVLAEDYTQETFLRAFDRLADFRGESRFSTWLHAVGVTVILNGLRKVKRIRRRETELEDLPEAAAKAKPIDWDLRLTLHKAIDELTDDLRLVFVMHDIEGYKHEEIAQILGVPAGTSKTRLMRAREALRVSLGGARSAAAKQEGQ